MRLKSIELSGFKSFAKKTELKFDSSITAIVGPNGSGKSNIAEAFRFVLGEQSMKSMRGRRGEDLIWNGSPAMGRAGRASVRLVLDNADRVLNLDFDEVQFERVVHRDGSNDYLLNGSTVRLRDIAELLAHAGIGSSGHHIISQGEADRILSASPRDRREMIEDALGLTAYLYKREDAERKLEKAQENMREVEALRRELAPHLKFLSGQVKKIEEGEKLREELANAYVEYLKREKLYLVETKEALAADESSPSKERHDIENRIQKLRDGLASKAKSDESAHELVRLEKEGSITRGQREELTREIGRLEGELIARESIAKRSEGATIPAKKAAAFAEEIAAALEEAKEFDLQALQKTVASLVHRVREFARSILHSEGGEDTESLGELKERKQKLEKELHDIQSQEERNRRSVSNLREDIESKKDASRQAERELFSAMARRSELESILAGIATRKEALARDEERFKEELREGGVLIGRGILGYESFELERGKVQTKESILEDRSQQEVRRRKLERLKIRLEEADTLGGAEVLKEHHETRERDEFLGRELSDLQTSAESLRALIAELTETLEGRFAQGIETITLQFSEFFKLMFGGGEAKLYIVKEHRVRRQASSEAEYEEGEEDGEDDAELEEGVEISVNLPHKRVKGLHMLSGGERALTSIALIFAMSQVNPPPFLILDETDAALDEANSRRYGDMIETLARKSQLILITHNRETMSRAGILYGITMGSEGVSKLLSVRFEEALSVAK
ncbi:MAG: AAA family ATPase [Patescibacteria group bacterium]|nr:AAA family ATPase [Patescibacteria group bacterium]